MYEVNLGYIEQKPSDFKVCNDCGSIVWYESEDCHSCAGTNFDDSKEAVMNAYEKEFAFWSDEYGSEVADSIMIEV